MVTYPNRFKRSVMREVEFLSSITRVWKFTAGHTGGRGFMDDFLKNKRIALGYAYNRGLGFVKTPKDLLRLKNRHGRSLSNNVKRQTWDFLSMMRGNIVALKLKDQVVALGVVTTGELQFDDSPLESRYFRKRWSYPNRKDVHWLPKFEPQPIVGEDFVKSFRFPQDTIHQITEQSSKNRILAWIISYRDNLATKKEKRIINDIGKIKRIGIDREVPKRIQTTSEIAEKEYSAIEKVKEYEEKKEKRTVNLTYDISVGYDLESKSDDDIRYIEVKSRRGSFPVTLTRTELKASQKLKDNYYLYVVTSEDEMFRLQNPSKLKKNKLAHIVWELEEWSSKAECIKI